MRWVDHPEGLDFASPVQRDFVIDSLVRIGVFDDLRGSFLEQRREKGTLLRLPSSHFSREVVRFISMYGEIFDREFESGSTYARLPLDTPQSWYRFWDSHLTEMRERIRGHFRAGADIECMNKYAWHECRRLVMQAGMDAYLMRVRRYATEAGERPRWFQWIAWRLRTLMLEWKWGKKKILYGAYERYDTDLFQDPAKQVFIHCGYCGTAIKDDSARPSGSRSFEPIVFRVSKGQGIVTIVSAASLLRYDKPMKCFSCGELLGNAYVNKVARAVMVVLL